MGPVPPWGLLVAPYERTTSFLEGAALGPERVLADLKELARGERAGLPSAVTCLEGSGLEGPVAMIGALDRATDDLAGSGLLPVMLGGEHTCTLGPLTALRRLRSPLGVIHLDAHADQRDRYEGSRYSHASVMRRAAEDLGLPVLSVGIRAFSQSEARFMKKRGIGYIPGHLLGRWRRLLPPLLDSLPPSVYLTVDMDFFDPAVVPGVGTPEPGGAGWYQGLDIIDTIVSRKSIAGFDIVELCPPGEGRVSVRAASRILLYLLEECGGDSAGSSD